MDYTKKRWLILSASCFINLCIGSMYAWSVFSAPMADYLQQLTGAPVSGADLAIVFVVCNSIGPITMITGGRINDSFGPNRVIFVGGLMFGGGMFLCGYASSITQLVLAYGVLTGLGLGMVYGATISTSIKFFPDKRGLVGGLTTALFGISSVIIPPIATMITEQMGVIVAFKLIGAAFLLIVCGCSLLFKKCPEDFRPHGWHPQATSDISPATIEKNWRKMLKTPVFYLLMILLMCGAVAGLMCIAMAAPLAVRMIGMSTIEATAAVSTLALFNVCGRIIAGFLSDKIGRINTLALACLLSILGLYVLYQTGRGDHTAFYIGIAVIGACFGAFMGVFPGLTADQFGTKNNSVNFGIMFCGFAVAGYVGPTIMGYVYHSTHSYKGAFLIGIVFCMVGLLATFCYRQMERTARENRLNNYS